jgi:hypothetical protein
MYLARLVGWERGHLEGCAVGPGYEIRAGEFNRGVALVREAA